ncbi:MAG: type IV secretory system conjugative DNA transfer family protein [Proteobacteria bacterium]|nr:type IV secretory system conjugative DNA transfer family protein [Pseudomonadota bacterium]
MATNDDWNSWSGKKRPSSKSVPLGGSLLSDTMKGIFKGGLYLLGRKLNRSKEGATFDSESDYSSYLNSSNNGLLLDGDKLRLSERDSIQNVCVMARIGAGKTSRYIIPNVLGRARSKCSIVVNDPKGEVYQNTSEHMRRSGFKVVAINPENLDGTSHFNPLSEARSDIEIEQIAEILVRSGTPTHGGKDDFWIQGSIRFANLFIKCLKNAGRTNQGYYNLHNLYYLFQNFGEDGRDLDKFMVRYAKNPDDPLDDTLWHEWQGVLTGNKEGVQSFILNGITALKSLSNRNLAELTSYSDISLEDIRKEKTIIYMITPAQHAEYYSFLTSLFFRSVFNACMRQLPDKRTLPVYVLYDEFGHSTIPNFVSTANTIRGYGVSISIILQSISQLRARYGAEYANSIQGGFNTYLTYAGADPVTADFFEKVVGRVRLRQKENYFDHVEQYQEYNLMNAGEVRTIDSDEALVVSGNRQPIKLKTLPYFQNWSLMRCANKGPAHLAPPESAGKRLQYVGLDK